MRLVIVRAYAQPERTWRTIGQLHGGRVELSLDEGVAHVRVDDWTRFRGGENLARQLAAMVERETGERVTELGSPLVR